MFFPALRSLDCANALIPKPACWCSRGCRDGRAGHMMPLSKIYVDSALRHVDIACRNPASGRCDAACPSSHVGRLLLCTCSAGAFFCFPRARAFRHRSPGREGCQRTATLHFRHRRPKHLACCLPEPLFAYLHRTCCNPLPSLSSSRFALLSCSTWFLGTGGTR
jgi:hypothetical protein